MVIIVYGTTGELIKVLPLIKSLPEDQQIRISTSQQPDQLEKLMREASIPAPHLTIAHGWHNHDLQKMSDMFFWLSGMLVRYPRTRRRLKTALHGRKATAVLVHGDTVTTVLGALWGRMRRLPVMHIEAGLRSGNWRHPFPEEIDRHLTSRFATTHFAPGAIPVKNLSAAKAKGQIIDSTIGGLARRDCSAGAPPARSLHNSHSEPERSGVEESRRKRWILHRAWQVNSVDAINLASGT